MIGRCKREQEGKGDGQTYPLSFSELHEVSSFANAIIVVLEVVGPCMCCVT